jgi:hypothetical protein
LDETTFFWTENLNDFQESELVWILDQKRAFKKALDLGEAINDLVFKGSVGFQRIWQLVLDTGSVWILDIFVRQL